MDEFIQLKWHTHQHAFLDTLSSLRDKQVFTDVTLSCGDQFYPAHRLVLASCSSFLAHALEVATCRAPVLLLHGIDQDTLEQLLMFMYDGQVTISRNELPKLLKAAQWLGVKGLDSAHDKHSANSTQSETENSDDFNPSQFFEVWRKSLSSLTSGNMDPGNVENGIKLYQQFFKKMQEFSEAAAHSSKTELELSKKQTRQEMDAQGGDISIDSLPNSVSLNSVREHTESSFPTQKGGNTNSSNSFNHWEDSEITLKEENEEDFVTPSLESEETSNINNFAESPDESARASKENNDEDTSKRSLRCKHCKKPFKVRTDLARHIRFHHDQTQNYCFICHTKFVTTKEFTIHMKIHKADKVHACGMCDFLSHSSYGLKKHCVLMHRGSSHSSGNAEVLTETKQKQKNKAMDTSKATSNSARVVCSVCKKRFKDKNIYKKHKSGNCIKILRCSKGFKCPSCGYEADRRRSVEDHMARHTGLYRFHCSHCPYQCQRNSALQEHISKRHPDFKPVLKK